MQILENVLTVDMVWLKLAADVGYMLFHLLLTKVVKFIYFVSQVDFEAVVYVIHLFYWTLYPLYFLEIFDGVFVGFDFFNLIVWKISIEDLNFNWSLSFFLLISLTSLPLARISEGFWLFFSYTG